MFFCDCVMVPGARHLGYDTRGYDTRVPVLLATVLGDIVDRAVARPRRSGTTILTMPLGDIAAFAIDPPAFTVGDESPGEPSDGGGGHRRGADRTPGGSSRHRHPVRDRLG